MADIYVGVDPGTVHLGLATLNEEAKWALALKVAGVDDAILAFLCYLEQQLQEGDRVVVACEDYAFMGPRKNYGAMNQLIGGSRGLCVAFNRLFYLVQPREKERAGKQLTRPKGQEDHAWDARCIAWLGREKHNARP